MLTRYCLILIFLFQLTNYTSILSMKLDSDEGNEICVVDVDTDNQVIRRAEYLSEGFNNNLNVCIYSVNNNVYKSITIDFQLSKEIMQVMEKELNADISDPFNIKFYNIPDSVFNLLHDYLKDFSKLINETISKELEEANMKAFLKQSAEKLFDKHLETKELLEIYICILSIFEILQKDNLGSIILPKAQLLKYIAMEVETKMTEKSMIVAGSITLLYTIAAILFAVLKNVTGCSYLEASIEVFFPCTVLALIIIYSVRSNKNSLADGRLFTYDDTSAAIKFVDRNYQSRYKLFLESNKTKCLSFGL